MADKYLKQDGSVFLFKPGEGGSLTDLKKRKPVPMDFSPSPRVAKVVPMNPDSDMQDNSIAPSIPSTGHGYSMNGEHIEVGSARG